MLQAVCHMVGNIFALCSCDLEIRYISPQQGCFNSRINERSNTFSTPLRAPGFEDLIEQIPSRECLFVLLDATRELSHRVWLLR